MALAIAAFAVAGAHDRYEDDEVLAEGRPSTDLMSLLQRAKGAVGKRPVALMDKLAPVSKRYPQLTALQQPHRSIAAESREPQSYAWECATPSTMTYNRTEFDVDEITRLQRYACADEEADGTARSETSWNTKHTAKEMEANLRWIVATSNLEKTPMSKAAALSVKLFVLRPFAKCNSKVASCASINLLASAGRMLGRRAEFFDFKERVEQNEALGTWDEKNEEWQLKDGEGELRAVMDMARWIDDHFVSNALTAATPIVPAAEEKGVQDLD